MSDYKLSPDRKRGWLVLLSHQRGFPVPMTIPADEDDGAATVFDVAVFATHAEAKRAGSENLIGAAYGFNVVKWP